MSLISIVIPCFNEEDNVVKIADKIRSIFKSQLVNDNYEIIFIDNGSTDKTHEKIKESSPTSRGLGIESSAAATVAAAASHKCVAFYAPLARVVKQDTYQDVV